MEMSELDFDLPSHLIATAPAEPRDHSRLLVYHRATDQIAHHHFFDLPTLLTPGDLLIVNQSKVLPAKLLLQKPTGAKIPGLFIKELSPGQWIVLLRSRGRISPGQRLIASPDIHLDIIERINDKGEWRVNITPALPASHLLAQIGHVPLPPYIEQSRKQAGTPEELPTDQQQYQTIYATTPGSIAAPTAGLHFTPTVLDQLQQRGIDRAPVTLHVGMGTFLPVETATLEAHPMHSEDYEIPTTTTQRLRDQRKKNARIVAVGTTAVRTLEAAAEKILNPTPPQDLHASTRLLISPGHAFQLTDALLTNFHLPKSTLLALVAAFLHTRENPGLPTLKKIYAQAIQQHYRFFSYGDAMLIL